MALALVSLIVLVTSANQRGVTLLYTSDETAQAESDQNNRALRQSRSDHLDRKAHIFQIIAKIIDMAAYTCRLAESRQIQRPEPWMVCTL